MNLKRTIFALSIIIALFLAGCETTPQTKKDTGYNAAIQASMAKYIEAKTVKNNGSYHIKGVKTELQYLHDTVKEKDGYYVSCADFTSADDRYDLDYYVKKNDDGFRVEKVVMHMKNGRDVSQILWMSGN